MARRVHGVKAAPGSPATVLVMWTARHGNNNRNALLRDPDGNLVEIVGKKS